ncbi:Crp/Fnr family transcriptional regulator [Isachenkonia alkalipeptolytica]|uniref:Crp/Fnr family transcriptional regulator n=1 Tax=Isachenkonia alkalipeptolytica TaxID=2565777 RepID=A0AA43XJY4_9CLOT|nr:Crp/Fnr family transcriptional regulator [Isachenkonia alkalipeptolytica]NBG87751.1 Crp/Fnr family transcriptional regulator [Isachenkonia alkalipeptolytica]
MKNSLLTKPQLQTISKSLLFQSIPPSSLELIFRDLTADIISYPDPTLIASEGEVCSGISLVLEGSVAVKKLHLSGKETTITELKPGDTFGEVIIFSDHKHFPSSLFSEKNTVILYISETAILRLCKLKPEFLKNLMGLLSNKVWMMSNKVRILSYDRLKQRVAMYLMDQYRMQGSPSINLPHNRQEMADYLGMPRPSLSRELQNLKDQGLIRYHKNHFTLLQPEKLEALIQ